MGQRNRALLIVLLAIATVAAALFLGDRYLKPKKSAAQYTSPATRGAGYQIEGTVPKKFEEVVYIEEEDQIQITVKGKPGGNPLKVAYALPNALTKTWESTSASASPIGNRLAACNKGEPNANWPKERPCGAEEDILIWDIPPSRQAAVSADYRHYGDQEESLVVVVSVVIVGDIYYPSFRILIE